MSQKKIIFFVVIAVLILALGIGFSVLSKGKKTESTSSAQEITVWVVGDDRVGFADIVNDFKKIPEYKDTKVEITKFATYADYERSLLSVIADGKSPDIFIVPSTGAGMLENQIAPLSSSVVDMEDFSKNLNALFDPLIETKPGKSEDGKEIQIRTIKGIPLGYETIGVFYNRSLVSGGVPATWEELASRPESTEDGETLPVALGYGNRYITQAASIATLFLAQAGIDSLTRLQDPLAAKAISEYQSYVGSDISDSTTNNQLYRLKEELDRKKISTTDLFVR
jgi:ABC-type glycerol-3-phosphate transport system substrate-binding protein